MSSSLHKMHTIAEVAEFLRCSERSLRRMIASKKLPHYRIESQIRISSSDLEAYLAKARIGGRY